MAFLPVVQRELIVTARKPFTYRLRLAVAGLAILIGTILLLIAVVARNPRGLGGGLFWTLAVGAEVFCLLAGLFLTADAISEERREGTLGLLFLSDLRSYEVVLGKFVACSLNAIYGVLAVLPVMAVAFVMGGVTGGEFWRVAVALLDTVFLSLAVGLAVSVSASQPARAMLTTLVALAVIGLLALFPLSPHLPAEAAWLSPLWLFSNAADSAASRLRGEFAGSALAVNGLGWFALAWASWRLSRNWREPAAPARGAAGRPMRLRRTLLDRNPVLALVSVPGSTRALAWLVALAGAATVAYLIIRQPGGGVMLMFLAPYAGFHTVLLGMLAWRACQWFAEARRSGELELLLATPLTNAEIVGGQWQALLRAFAGPLCVLLGALLVGSVRGWTDDAFNSNNASRGLDRYLPLLMGLGITVYHLATIVMDFAAVAALGMRMGLTKSRPTQAFGWTFLGLVVLPSMLFCIPRLGVSIPVFFWARSELRRDLRRVVERRLHPHSVPVSAWRGPLPPVLPAGKKSGVDQSAGSDSF